MNIDVKTTSSFPNLFNRSLSFTSEKMANNLPFVIVGIIVILGFLLFISTIPKSKSMSSNIYSSLASNGLNRSSTSSSSSAFYIVEILIWSMVVFLLVINGLRYIFDIDITSQLTGLFSHDPNLNVHVKSKSLEKRVPKPSSSSDTDSVSSSFGKEVFHISDNSYSYNDAKAICKAYNAELANYDQIKKSHASGAEWCSYGWSEDQMVFFPTQKSTYEMLKKKKGHEHDCGRPGINGGYISNPNAKFGVNCYGKKPKNANGMQFATVEYKTEEDRAIDKKVSEYKNKLNDIPLAPFNKTKWSKF